MSEKTEIKLLAEKYGELYLRDLKTKYEDDLEFWNHQKRHIKNGHSCPWSLERVQSEIKRATGILEYIEEVRNV